jgi:hypothetical protein
MERVRRRPVRLTQERQAISPVPSALAALECR